MVFEAFGYDFPFWLAPLNTLLLLAVFMGFSLRGLRDVAKNKKKG